MKNVILGIFGAFLAVYTAVLALCMYNIYARKDELDNSLAEVMESAMEEYYAGEAFADFKASCSDAQMQQYVEEALRLRLNLDADMEITFTACDMEKGILSVAVVESFPLLNGKTHMISAQKTLIADRTGKAQTLLVQYYVDGELYKECQLTQGQLLVLPKAPEGNFKGWKKQGQNGLYDFAAQDGIWENMIFEAVFGS